MATLPDPDPGTPVPAEAPAFGGGPRSPRGPGRIPNAKIAIVVLLGALAMLFTGLLGAFLVLRWGAPEWPPTGLPRLPIGVTWANTVVLLASALTMRRAVGAARQGERDDLGRALGVTAFLGCVFLLVQGSEWIQLLGHGLTPQTHTYGATFYLLIGAHGAHVLGAVLWLLEVTRRVRAGRFASGASLPVELVAIYWTFVCALWLVIFPLVYLL